MVPRIKNPPKKTKHFLETPLHVKYELWRNNISTVCSYSSGLGSDRPWDLLWNLHIVICCSLIYSHIYLISVSKNVFVITIKILSIWTFFCGRLAHFAPSFVGNCSLRQCIMETCLSVFTVLNTRLYCVIILIVRGCF